MTYYLKISKGAYGSYHDPIRLEKQLTDKEAMKLINYLEKKPQTKKRQGPVPKKGVRR
jgi:hypothetical protein